MNRAVLGIRLPFALAGRRLASPRRPALSIRRGGAARDWRRFTEAVLRFGSAIVMALGAMLGGAAPAAALVRVEVDLGLQRMRVFADTGESYQWPISSGRLGLDTPRGDFKPTAFYPIVYSYKYGNEPMPHSIFFEGQYAIHGTYETDRLGRPASHGCIRLAPDAAATLYALVKREGAVITIGGAPEPAPYLVAPLLPRPGGRALELPQVDPLAAP